MHAMSVKALMFLVHPISAEALWGYFYSASDERGSTRQHIFSASDERGSTNLF